MPRQARITGEYLHVIIRGNGKQIIFEEDIDRMFFLKLLHKYSREQEVSVAAYCLMSNHVHLLIHDPKREIAVFMKKLDVTYVIYYNKKYDHAGHLFQGRYKSENIMDERYLLAVYRYILKNPEKAGIARASNYRWNSYAEYGKTNRLTDTSLLVSLIGSQKDFENFMAEDDDREYMEDVPQKRDDIWAQEEIRRILHLSDPKEILKMEKAKRDQSLAALKGKRISIRQLERIVGISRNTIQRVWEKWDK